MTAAELKALRKCLIAEERYLLSEIEGQIAEQEMLAEAAGEERSSGSSDGGSEIFEQEKTLAVECALEDMLAEVRHALRKMDTASCGKCDDCGQAIAVDRLLARPQASLYLLCKTKQERMHHSPQTATRSHRRLTAAIQHDPAVSAASRCRVTSDSFGSRNREWRTRTAASRFSHRLIPCS